MKETTTRYEKDKRVFRMVFDCYFLFFISVVALIDISR